MTSPRAAAIGDVFTFPIPRVKQWGLCQIIDAFTYDNDQAKVYDASWDGHPFVTLAFCNWATALQPTLNDLSAATLLSLNYASWRDEAQIINVEAGVPQDFVLLGAAEPFTKLDGRCRSWGGWHSTMRYLRLQQRWAALPVEMTRAYKAALASEATVTLPGSLGPDGEPRQYRLKDTDFSDGGPGTIAADFQLSAVRALPAISKLTLNRWYDDLPQFLAATPTIGEVVLTEHGRHELDISISNVRELSVDVAGLTHLRLPATLEDLRLVGDLCIEGLTIEIADDGAELSLSAGAGHERLHGISKLEQLKITGVAHVDMAIIADAFPDLRIMKVWGAPTIFGNMTRLGDLAALECVWLFEAFGFGADEFPGASRLPSLTTMWIRSIPSDVAAAIKKRYGKRSDVDLTVERPRKPEWLAENLDNPLRAWDGRDGIPATSAKKAFSAYKVALKSMRHVAAAGGPAIAIEAENVTRTFIETLNAADARRTFIYTMERDEIVDALNTVWELLPESVDRRSLETLVETLRDF